MVGVIEIDFVDIEIFYSVLISIHKDSILSDRSELTDLNLSIHKVLQEHGQWCFGAGKIVSRNN